MIDDDRIYSRPLLVVIGGVVFVFVVIAVIAVTSAGSAELGPAEVGGPVPPPDAELGAVAIEAAAPAYFAGEAAARSAEYAALAYVTSLPPPASTTATDPRPSREGATTSGAGGALAAIRQCESGGDYRAVSPSGQYRGAYQFDFQTWNGVGGTGDPAAASPAEQDLRAGILYEQRGTQPWPVCGR